jgi:dTDP-glucose 4,6-dehydratase
MKILVCGGAGFIGSNLLRLLHADDHVIATNLDLLTYAGRRENLRDLEGGARYDFVHGDICDVRLLDRILGGAGFDAIINLAAETHVDRSILGASAFARTNVVGTQTLLDAAVRHGVSRFLQVSTDEVYGDIPLEAPPATEASALRPSSPYAASKASADLMCLAAFRTHGLPVVITRCSNNYGPFQFPEKFLPMVVLRATRSLPVPIYGNGHNIRDWIHVDDHCRGILAALDRGSSGQVYNLGASCERTNLDVARVVLDHLGCSRDLLTFVEDRPGHDFRYALDFSKARDELGFLPILQFETALLATVQWYVQHPGSLDGKRPDEFARYFNDNYNSRGMTIPGEAGPVDSGKSFVHGPIDGVAVRHPESFEDARGWLAEFYRADEAPDGFLPQMGYVSMTRAGMDRGPHEHRLQTDAFFFGSSGTFRLVLWDNRADSATFGNRMVMDAGEGAAAVVLVPPGVVHAYCCISEGGGLVANLPDRLYRGTGRRDEVDEIRYENDPESPFMLDLAVFKIGCPK